MRPVASTPERRLQRARWLLVSREAALADFEIAVIREAFDRVRQGLGPVTDLEQQVIDSALEAMLAASDQTLDADLAA